MRHSPRRFVAFSLTLLPDMLDIDALDFTKGNGLVTVVAQDSRTGVLLMVAHADREALERTIATGEMHYRSRSRGLWHKGETSRNVQRVVSLTADCDGDAVLALVDAGRSSVVIPAHNHASAMQRSRRQCLCVRSTRPSQNEPP